MSDVDVQIKNRVNSFVEEITALVRKSALEAVSSALKGSGGASAALAAAAPAKRRGRPPKNAPKAAAPAAAAKPAAKAAAKGGRRKPGEKRSSVEIEATIEKLTSFIAANPGLGIEHIAKGLNTSTRELVLPVKKLLSEKKITSKGQKRATRYFPK
jgi:hypothetical protein